MLNEDCSGKRARTAVQFDPSPCGGLLGVHGLQDMALLADLVVQQLEVWRFRLPKTRCDAVQPIRLAGVTREARGHEVAKPCVSGTAVTCKSRSAASAERGISQGCRIRCRNAGEERQQGSPGACKDT